MHTVLPNFHIITHGVEILIAREAWLYYLRGPQGHIAIRYEHVRTHLYVETAELRQPVSEPSPSARIRASPVSPYESQPRQPVWEPAQSARVRSIYATLPPLATLCGARKQTNKQTNKDNAQIVIPIVASLKPCLISEQGKSTTVAWGWPSI
jgi:hypothetical protein